MLHAVEYGITCAHNRNVSIKEVELIWVDAMTVSVHKQGECLDAATLSKVPFPAHLEATVDQVLVPQLLEHPPAGRQRRDLKKTKRVASASY